MATASHRLDLVVRSIQASLTGDSSVVEELFSPDVRASLPMPAFSAVELAVEIEDRRDAFVDVQVGTLQSQDFGPHSWVEWFASVTHVGELVNGNTSFEPTGRRAVLHGVTFAEFDGDRIVAYHQSWDCSDLEDS
jgi:ketosteroid isomerase-like protein